MTSPAFSVRRGLPADAAALAAFAARTFEETYAVQNTTEDLAAHLAASFDAEIQAAELASSDVVTLLVEAESTLAGFAQVRRNEVPQGVQAPAPVELWRFYVDRRWQGKGMAWPLMEAVRQAALELDARSLWLSVFVENPKAVRFYEKCGFRIAGSATFTLGEDVQADHVMVLDLTDGSPRGQVRRRPGRR